MNAERAGFEPAVGVAYDSLANCSLRPLGHLSKITYLYYDNINIIFSQVYIKINYYVNILSVFYYKLNNIFLFY